MEPDEGVVYRRVSLNFPEANQSDIIRSFQKDQYYTKLMTDKAEEIVQELMGLFLFPLTFFIFIFEKKRKEKDLLCRQERLKRRTDH